MRCVITYSVDIVTFPIFVLINVVRDEVLYKFQAEQSVEI